MANENGSSVGQVVRLGIAESLFMRMVLRLYGLPLLTGLAGAVAGYGLATSLGAAGFLADVVTLIAACISVGGVLIFLKTTTTQHVSSMDIHVLESTSSNADCAYGENEDPVNS